MMNCRQLNLFVCNSMKISCCRLKHKSALKNPGSNGIQLALEHFDSLYSKVFYRQWPSIRLGLLSTKKQCIILNSFGDTEDLHRQLVEEHEALDIQRYYRKHLRAYIRHKLREEIITNKKARKRELLLKSSDVDSRSLDLDSIEVSDVSDSELRGSLTTDASEGFSSAEDLHAMFSDRRSDGDESYFVNRASKQLSLDEYVPATEFISQDETIDQLTYYEGYEEVELNVEVQDEPYLELGNELKIYSFPRNTWSQFEQPKKIPTAGLFTHYFLDGASILPVLALDLRLNDVCADYCAAPGGKSLAMLMTFRPRYLLCNDYSASRCQRLTNVMKHSVPDLKYSRSTINFSRKDAMSLVHPDTFDKILVDVPCSNDRLSTEILDNNLFKRSRLEERLRLPSIQTSILKSALKSLKINGSVVYSTCTMSPIENDGVVQRSLLQLQEEGHSYKFAIINLKEAFRPLRGLFKFDMRSKHGQQVVPNICSNFGPMYICKIKRLA